VNVRADVRDPGCASRRVVRGWRIAELDAEIVGAVEEVVGEKLELLGGSRR
jgi:hypothetical protein